jgi:hypothetical protein
MGKKKKRKSEQGNGEPTGRLVRENFDWQPRHTLPSAIAVFFHSIFMFLDLCCFLPSIIH